MKKALSLLLALALMLSVASAFAENLSDKEIQFSGHTFGESVADALGGKTVSGLNIQNLPATSRILADPYANSSSWAMFTGPLEIVTFNITVNSDGPTKVAGHETQPTLYFYDPSASLMKTLDFSKSVFYAGRYEFWNDPEDTFADLKTKLTASYGEPYADTDNPDDIWGPLTASDPSMQAQLEAAKVNAQIEKLSVVCWKSSVNKGMIILVKTTQWGNTHTSLYYVDESADETILSLANANNGASSANDDMNGL